jgi:hypothetical protein
MGGFKKNASSHIHGLYIRMHWTPQHLGHTFLDGELQAGQDLPAHWAEFLRCAGAGMPWSDTGLLFSHGLGRFVFFFFFSQ